ncbi:DNA replication/repair protein RecF [Parasediminibacterium sp. JCM 36343]|uniref:DNA replication/repair protein RecF n=1 Tax=Parasediminibacterium sp. JCM 36343 TaxID=3374279 RepID=UPI00397A9AA4
MLQLQQISLVQFRNYASQQFAFTEKVVGICGLNGSGKTNLLDAIYYLGFTKSYFTRSDSQNVHHGTEGMRLQGEFLLNDEPQQVVSILRENNRKEFSINGSEYKKFSEHIGRLPCVMIAPDDIALIIGGSEERRKFIDTILSQIDREYLQQLIDYTKILQQRNSLLKQANEQGNINEALLQILNEQLAHNGEWIYKQRSLFLGSFLQLTSEFYTRIAGKDDMVAISYESNLQNGAMLQLLQSSRQKDMVLQRTTIGVHKDDLIVKMGERPFKNEASQGQRKSLLFALKLAEWQTLKTQKGFSPILLLDDVFEKLDEERMHNLLGWVCTDNGGQVFITDTHKERLQGQLGAIGVAYQLIEL